MLAPVSSMEKPLACFGSEGACLRSPGGWSGRIFSQNCVRELSRRKFSVRSSALRTSGVFRLSTMPAVKVGCSEFSLPWRESVSMEVASSSLRTSAFVLLVALRKTSTKLFLWMVFAHSRTLPSGFLLPSTFRCGFSFLLSRLDLSCRRDEDGAPRPFGSASWSLAPLRRRDKGLRVPLSILASGEVATSGPGICVVLATAVTTLIVLTSDSRRC
mmetsp:Transcript_15703/g.59721  ORF Transcript_15703/g.59721 Transcript_15703/m.59721 type:complete len:215 (+) Transcript_15703:1960-2604(+)